MAKVHSALDDLNIKKSKSAKQKGLPKRASNPRKKARHKECWERGQVRKARRREVQEAAHRANLAK